MIWFTADYHLSHKNIIKYCNRPFKNVEEMNSQIIYNLEKSVKTGDILYYLGDLTFETEVALEFFEKFKDIKIHFIIGNHDSLEVIEIAYKFCATVSCLKVIKINGQMITLCHYPINIDNYNYNSYCLHGHSHGKKPQIGMQLDVSVDNSNFCPLSYRKLTEIMKKR